MIIYHVTIAVETFARVISETLKIKCWKLISDGEIFCWAIKTLETLVNGWSFAKPRVKKLESKTHVNSAVFSLVRL